MTSASVPAIETVAPPIESCAATPVPSLRKRFIRATVWTILGTHGGQFIRLASNLVLTRLLFPEAFGLMAVAHLVIHALTLFSDIGIAVSLVQDPRGEERSFVNTAWTLQVIRGFTLWLATGAAAVGLFFAGRAGWLPAGSAFADPRLLWILPVAGLTCITAGFNSTNLIALRRRLTVGHEVLYQLCGHLLHVAIIIAWAWIHPTVWALVAGGVVASALMTIVSHVCIRGPRNRFAWDRKCAADLIRFGRFIFLSTIFMFIGMSAQKAILGGIMTADLFGVFAIALVMSSFVQRAVDRMYQNVLLPLYSELVRRKDPAGLCRTIARVRLRLLALTLPPMCVLAVAGHWVIRWLYDPRYHEAGWMLQILSVGALVTLLSTTIESIMLAHGDAKRHLQYTAGTSVLLVLCMTIGAIAGGVMGVLIAAIIGKLMQHIVLCFFVRRYGVCTPRLDATALALSAAVIAAGWWLIPS